MRNANEKAQVVQLKHGIVPFEWSPVLFWFGRRDAER